MLPINTPDFVVQQGRARVISFLQEIAKQVMDGLYDEEFVGLENAVEFRDGDTIRSIVITVQKRMHASTLRETLNGEDSEGHTTKP